MEKDIDHSVGQEDFEEGDFEEIDAMIEYLKELPRNEVFILNAPRIEQMRFSCAAIKRAMREHKVEAKIVCKQSDLEPSMGYVDVEAKDIGILDMEWFARASEFANNTEIYPLKDDRVRMTFTFHGILAPLQ